jgi:carbon-monoxide dehydrogenase iron sulfur subunit
LKSSLKLIPDKCTGCRTCEIACSFHFNKTFNPESSKIKIHFETSTGNMKISIEKGCDKCKGEEEPLCAKFCAPGAIILKNNSR